MTGTDEAFRALRAQLDEDHTRAQASDPRRHREIVTEVLATGRLGVHHQAFHIARWSPGRVVAKATNMRLVLDELELLGATRPLTARTIAQLLLDDLDGAR